MRAGDSGIAAVAGPAAALGADRFVHAHMVRFF